MAAEPAYAEWLQSPERLTVATEAAVAVAWGDLAVAQAASCVFDAEASALAEAARQLAFVGGPLVEERLVIGRAVAIGAVRGRCVTITCAEEPAYAAGALVFVLGGDVDRASGTTRLDVLRRL